jgi:hypothetical protein
MLGTETGEEIDASAESTVVVRRLTIIVGFVSE